MKDTYKPQAGSLASKMIAFFLANPDEQLTRKDIAEKFDCASTSIANSLSAAIEAGAIADVYEGELLTRVFTAGEHIKTFAAEEKAAAMAATGFKGWLERKGAKSAEGRSAPPPPLPKVAELLGRIEAGIAIPSAAPRGAEYHEVWGQMQAGESVVMDTLSAKRLITNAQRWGKLLKRKFVMRQMDGTSSRIFRVE